MYSSTNTNSESYKYVDFRRESERIEFSTEFEPGFAIHPLNMMVVNSRRNLKLVPSPKIESSFTPLKSGIAQSSPVQGGKVSPTSSVSTSTTAVESIDSSFIGVCIPCSPDTDHADVLMTTGVDKSLRSSVSMGSSLRRDYDSTRKSLEKTELCKFFLNGEVCTYGEKCIFAHGEEELKLTKLREKCRADHRLDEETYRTKPCFTWISTGACSFGIRCPDIHDPRVKGTHKWWLPLTETRRNSVATDIDVEIIHKKRQNCVYFGTPFGSSLSLELDGFDELYKLICSQSDNTRRRKCSISPSHKLEIALKMRGGPGWHYKFHPQNVIFNELCMVIQKKAFYLPEMGAVVEIPLTSYRDDYQRNVIVRELAFGPDSDPTVRGVALWFNISEEHVTFCASDKWRKNFKEPMPSRIPSPFDLQDCFYMIRPLDDDAFEFATKVLNNRLAFERTEKISGMRARHEALQSAHQEREILRTKFENQRRHWIAWAWPSNIGRSYVDEETLVPPVDGLYHPDLNQLRRNDGFLGSAIETLWSAFVQCPFSDKCNKNDPAGVTPVVSGQRPQHVRLSIFAKLEKGEILYSKRDLPHIRTCRQNRIYPEIAYGQKSEQFWRRFLYEWDVKKKSRVKKQAVV